MRATRCWSRRACGVTATLSAAVSPRAAAARAARPPPPPPPSPMASPALDALAARREAIAGEVAKLEKTVRALALLDAHHRTHDAGGGQGRSRRPAVAQRHHKHAPAPLAPPPPPRTQIYEQEAEYLNADYTHFGTVLKAR